MSLDFELKHENKPKSAVLLFHGMTGSPFEMKKYGKSLHSCGHDVFCYCLPGHGDRAYDICNVTWEDWVNESIEKYEKLKSEYDEVYLSGLCLGAVLALAIAAQVKNVKGVICLSTTLFLDGWTIPWYNFLMPLGLHTIFRYYYTFPEREPYGLKNEIIRRKIAALQKRNTVALDHYPLSCVYELLKLSKYTQKNMSKVTAPALIIHSTEDDLTSKKSAEFTFNKISSEIKENILLDNSYHMIVLDNEKEFVFQTVQDFINKLSATDNNKEEALA